MNEWMRENTVFLYGFAFHNHPKSFRVAMAKVNAMSVIKKTRL